MPVEFELNPDLDRKALKAAFKKDRRVLLADFLAGDGAEQLFAFIATRLRWGLSFNEGEKAVVYTPDRLAGMTGRRQRDLLQKIFTRAQTGYQYLYKCFPITTDPAVSAVSDEIIHDLLDFLNGDAVLALIREISGVTELAAAEAEVAFFAQQHFAGRHDGGANGGGKRLAFEFGLTRDWRTDWGGYLQFFDEDGDVVAGIPPGFNTLTLFALPQDHNIGMIAPFTDVARLAISGRFSNRPADDA